MARYFGSTESGVSKCEDGRHAEESAQMARNERRFTDRLNNRRLIKSHQEVYIELEAWS